MNRGLWSASAADLTGRIRAREVSCVEGHGVGAGPHRGAQRSRQRDRRRMRRRSVACGRTQGPGGRPRRNARTAARRAGHHQGERRCRGTGHHERLARIRESHRAGSLSGGAQPARWRGAIIVGRTNTPELSMRGTTVNPLRGPDPQSVGRRCLAGRIVRRSRGRLRDGLRACSPRQRHRRIAAASPRSRAGVATVKPTFGRVPAFNPSASAERGLLAQLISVQGVICREVRDVRLATRVLAGGDPRDPWWMPVPFDGPRIEPPLRVAVTNEPHGYPIHPQIVAGIERAADVLSDAGYAVERVTTPSIMKPATAWFDVLVSEIAHFLGPRRARSRQRDHPGHLRALSAHRESGGFRRIPAGDRQTAPP